VPPVGIEKAYDAIEAGVRRVLDAGAVPMIAGGDHSISLPILRAVARKHGPVSLVQFDSHIDTWGDYFGGPYYHGSPFRRAIEEALLAPGRYVQVGIRGPMYGEEEDFGGSTFHVEQIAPHTSSIVLEMIAYTAAEQNVPGALDGLLDLPERGDFVALIANPDSAELIDLILGGADPELATFPLVAPVSFLPTVARSDHLPYWQTGHRSLLVTDTAEYRNPHYHQESDGLDQLDLGFAARVTEAVTRALAV